MSQKPLKLGFIGGAPNSAVGYAHFVASQMDRHWQLVAGAFSRHLETGSMAAQTYGVTAERCYPNIDEMLQHEAGRLDAVTVLTPTPLHHSMVQQCLAAGLPVICEKSLALTSGEAMDIHRLWTTRHGFVAVIFNYSAYPMVREMRQMIRDGVLGTILHFQAEMPQEGFIRVDSQGNKPVPQDWRRVDGPIPTIHLDLGVHLHELINYLTGLEPLEVIADQASRGWFDVIDNVSCLCRYSQRVQGHVWFSKCALGHRNGLRLRIYGSKGSLEWFQASPEEAILSFADGRRQILDRGAGIPVASHPRYTRFKSGHPAGFIEALANLYGDIATALHHYRATGVQQSDEVFGPPLAIQGLALLEAMTRSCATGRWEKVQAEGW